MHSEDEDEDKDETPNFPDEEQDDEGPLDTDENEPPVLKTMAGILSQQSKIPPSSAPIVQAGEDSATGDKSS